MESVLSCVGVSGISWRL
uniref:Uncharacterized protein n=1 Tax=Rhizophora mucronata TaxID=61149 RepID=A0A2P2MAV7_RHIMU